MCRSIGVPRNRGIRWGASCENQHSHRYRARIVDFHRAVDLRGSLTFGGCFTFGSLTCMGWLAYGRSRAGVWWMDDARDSTIATWNFTQETCPTKGPFRGCLRGRFWKEGGRFESHLATFDAIFLKFLENCLLKYHYEGLAWPLPGNDARDSKIATLDFTQESCPT